MFLGHWFESGCHRNHYKSPWSMVTRFPWCQGRRASPLFLPEPVVGCRKPWAGKSFLGTQPHLKSVSRVPQSAEGCLLIFGRPLTLKLTSLDTIVHPSRVQEPWTAVISALMRFLCHEQLVLCEATLWLPESLYCGSLGNSRRPVWPSPQQRLSETARYWKDLVWKVVATLHFHLCL